MAKQPHDRPKDQPGDHSGPTQPPIQTPASQTQPNRSQCLISFGSNLGDRRDLIAEAARRISASPVVPDGCQLRTSRLFETPPIGGPDGQSPFLNAVGAFDTNTSAREILALLQSLEIDLGRQRHLRWAARSIDLDVVLHGELVGGGTGLIVPHPRYTARQFVLKPACDVAAHYRDPRFGWTMQTLADHISAGNASMALVGGDLQTRQTLCQQLADRYQIRTFAAKTLAEPMLVVGNAPVPASSPTSQTKTSERPEKDESVEPRDPDSSPAPGTRPAPVGAASHAAMPNESEQLAVEGNEPWVSAFLPPLPPIEPPATEATTAATVPRLVARLQRMTEETRWPAPHQMWPAGWEWPEYRLEVDDLAWAVSELASALDSMRCEVNPVTEDGNWW